MRLISCPASTLNRTTQSNTRPLRRGICINSHVLKVLYFLSAFNPLPSRVLPACQGAFLQGPRLPLQTRLGSIFNGCPKPRTLSATIRSAILAEKCRNLRFLSLAPPPPISVSVFFVFLPVLKLSQLLLHPFLFTVPLLLFGWLGLLVSTPLKGTFLRLFFDARFFSFFCLGICFFYLAPLFDFFPHARRLIKQLQKSKFAFPPCLLPFASSRRPSSPSSSSSIFFSSSPFFSISLCLCLLVLSRDREETPEQKVWVFVNKNESERGRESVPASLALPLCQRLPLGCQWQSEFICCAVTGLMIDVAPANSKPIRRLM